MPDGASFGALPSNGAAGLGTAMETFLCPHDKVGRVIGRAGATIRELEASTNTRIQVDHKAPGEAKPVSISGQREDVDRAKRMVLDLIENDSAPPGAGAGAAPVLPGDVQQNVECPAGIVGRIIGRGGETIRTLQQASGAHILINQDFPEGVPRQITISGRRDSVDRAASMIAELIHGDPASAQAVAQKVCVIASCWPAPAGAACLVRLRCVHWLSCAAFAWIGVLLSVIARVRHWAVRGTAPSPALCKCFGSLHHTLTSCFA